MVTILCDILYYSSRTNIITIQSFDLDCIRLMNDLYESVLCVVEQLSETDSDLTIGMFDTLCTRAGMLDNYYTSSDLRRDF